MKQDIKTMFELNPTLGDVGIEIELEGKSPFPYGHDCWNSEHDHSLRGNNMEYILSNPCNVDEVKEKLEILQKHLDKYKVVPIYTERAGVHVHVNVQDHSVEEVVRFALLYYSFEEVLTKFCGPDREGNHFCLRVKDAEAPLAMIEKMTSPDSITNFNDNKYRYAALNFCSLFRFGSLEFRAMESKPDLSKIDEWARILVAFRDFSLCSLKSRTEIAEKMSLYGPDTMLKEIVGEELFKLLWYRGAEQEVINSMRLIQMALFAKKL